MLSIVSLLQSNHTVNLMFVGDAMQHAPQITAAQQPDGTYDYTPCFQYIEDDVRWADLAVVNLECPSYAQRLKDVGFDLFLTANNHCLDRRDKGLVRTYQALDSMGIAHIGTYPNDQERAKRIPYIVNIKGMKIAFLDYTYGTNGIPIQGDVIVDFIDQQQIADDISLARERGAHAICVNLHWGIEYQLKPVASQRTLADWLVTQGVDLIIGGHPHGQLHQQPERHRHPWRRHGQGIVKDGKRPCCHRRPALQTLLRPETRRPWPELRPHPRGASRPAASRLQSRIHPLHATHPLPRHEQQQERPPRTIDSSQFLPVIPSHSQL